MSFVKRFAIAIAAGLAVFLLLFPTSGVDTLPPTCWSMFGYEVSCSNGLSVGAGAATTVVAGLLLRPKTRRGRENVTSTA